MLIGALGWMPGCIAGVGVPEQDQFVPLDSLSESGEAVVRLYAAPLPRVENIAIHTWFAVKPADASTFHRWEVWPRSDGPFDHVRLDLGEPTAHVGSGGVVVLADLIGPEAEPIIRFIQEESPGYPERGRYRSFPGPNSNSYTQWVLDHTGWDVTLPPRAIGKRLAPD